MSSLPIVDVLILGGGHAGLAAALSLYRALHTCLVFDSDNPRNRWDTPIHLTPGFENQSSSEVRRKCRAELSQSSLISFVDTLIDTIARTEDGLFCLSDGHGQKWQGRAVLLASGAKDVYPDIKGYEENFTQTIFPCMFTFGYERRGMSPSAGVLAIEALGNPIHATMLAEDALKFTKTVTIYTNTNDTLANALSPELYARGILVDNRKIVALRADAPGSSSSNILIEFENGETKTEGFLTHRPQVVVERRLAEQLGLEFGSMGEIRVHPPFFRTSMPKVYAAGDCASPLRCISNAVFMGACVAAGIARELPKTEARDRTTVNWLPHDISRQKFEDDQILDCKANLSVTT